MDYISRKVFLTRNLVSFDSDGDGVMDSLVISATTKHIQIPLRMVYDDMGIFEILPPSDEIDIIDVGSLWNDGIRPLPRPKPSVIGQTIDWGNGDINGGEITTNSQEIIYCNDVTANNYQELSFSNGVATLTTNGTSVPYNTPFPTFIPGGCLYDNNQFTDPGSTQGSNETDFVSIIQNKVSTTSTNACANWISAPNLSTAWAIYESTALIEAKNHCIAMGRPDVNFVTFPVGSVPSTCTNWNSIFSSPNLIGVNLNAGQSESGCNVFQGGPKYKLSYCFQCAKI